MNYLGGLLGLAKGQRIFHFIKSDSLIGVPSKNPIGDSNDNDSSNDSDKPNDIS